MLWAALGCVGALWAVMGCLNRGDTMEFKEFAHSLYGIIGSQQKVGTFVRTLFENIVTEDGLTAVNDLEDDTFRNYYNGKNGISKIARSIAIYTDAEMFVVYMDQFSEPTVQSMLIDSFISDIPDITQLNLSDKLAELFVTIIKDAAGTTRKAKTEKMTASVSATNATNLLAAVPKLDGYEEYLTKAMAFYREVKTLLYTEKPRRFYDFYVCNDLKFQSRDERVTANIPNVTAELLRMAANRIIITGTGGIGKTMMMRHLFFDCVKHYEDTGVIPILMLLRDYKDTYTDFADVLYKTVTKFTDDVTWESFQKKLAKGQCVILLDGLDEAIGPSRDVFETAINEFLMKHPDNLIVVTSRPTSTFVQMGFFQLFSIEPFTKEQAIALIDKLDFHDKEVKEAFKVDLDQKLYDSHKEFAGNPLLLTIMLMTYDSYGDVPAKRHIFYRKAYEVMARLHDTTKGTYVRPMHTKLEPDEFAEYFAEFCARTYRDGVLEFTKKEFCSYMDKVIAKKAKCSNVPAASNDVSGKNFLLDLTDNLCIFYQEGERYYFIHRSFQEYFCAAFFSEQMDDKLGTIGDFFETQQDRAVGDITFDMLYNMIPNKIDRYVLLPHLQQLWKHYDSAQGYQSFLIDMYGRIYITKTTDSTYVHYGPASFLYDFVLRQQRFGKQQLMEQLTWPPSIALCERIEWNMDALISKALISKASIFNEQEALIGADYWIYLNKVYADPDKFSDLIAFIESDDFPLKQEYNQVGQYIKQLELRYNSEKASDDWFDNF